MPYVKTINEDGVVSDIMAKALDPTLDAAVLKHTNLQNDFTQTEAGVNALDAAAGKTLNDSLATLSTDVSTNYATKTDLVPTPVTITRSDDSSVGTSTSIQCYKVGKIVVFWGSIYLKNVSANSNVVCASGFPKPITNFTTTSSGGYSVSNNMAIWVQNNDGTIRLRPHTAISSTEVEIYVSGAYIES